MGVQTDERVNDRLKTRSENLGSPATGSALSLKTRGQRRRQLLLRWVRLEPPSPRLAAGLCSRHRGRCGRRMQGLLGAEPRGLGEGAQVAAILSCEPGRYIQR